MTDARSNIVKVANWGPPNHARFTYSEGADRMADVHNPFAAHITCDCSAWVTYCYAWAGAPDPNGLNFDGEGYTGSELSHDEHIALFKKNAKGINVEQVLPGDLIVYGPGTGWHVAIVVEATADCLTVSHGKPGDPSFVRVSQDGRQPQTYLRCDTTQVRPPAPFPGEPKPKPAPGPTPAQLKDNNLVLLPNAAAAALARKNGWGVRVFENGKFPLAPATVPTGTPEYSYTGYKAPKPEPKPLPTKDPTPQQISKAGFVTLTDPSQVNLAHANGWPVSVWEGTKFITLPPPFNFKVTHYADFHWASKKTA